MPVNSNTNFKIFHIHVMEDYVTLKRKEILVLATMWMNLEDMLGELSQSHHRGV